MAPPPGYGAAAGPVDGLPYHRLAQNRGAAWRRLAAGVLAGSAGLILGPVVVILTGLLVARALGFDSFEFNLDNGLVAGEMLALNLGLALLIPVSALAYWGIYRQRPRWLGSVRPGIRVPWLAACFGMALAVWAVLIVLGTAGAAATRTTPIDSGVLWLLVVVLLTTPLQAAGEEYLFRGLLLQGLGATRLPTWACCVVSGAVFATAHAQFSPALFADRFLLGFVFAWLAVKTGGLEAGIAIHAVKNLAGLIPAALLDDVSATLDPRGVNWLPLIVDVVLLSILVPWLLATARKRVLQGRQRPTYTGPPPTAAQPSAT